MGGCALMRYWPSTTSASLFSACTLSRFLAFAAMAWARFSAFLAAAFLDLLAFPSVPSFLIAANMSRSDRCAYQTSILPISANPSIASRYARTESRVTACVSASEKPLFRAAIVKLAASRSTSYSNGPGSVSSKSFTSNSSVRSGESEHPEVRQVGVAAELHREAGPWRVLQVGRHDLRRAAVEGERRRHHPTVADGYEILLARRVLLLEQRDGIGTVRGRLPSGVVRVRHPLAQLLAAGLALGDARVLDLRRGHLSLRFGDDDPTPTVTGGGP